nr:SdrD B-like domain-containing protein [Corynebacterium diphtheriae]
MAILTSLSVVGTMTTTVAVESQEVAPSRLSRYKANEPWALVGPEVKNPEYRTEDFRDPRTAVTEARSTVNGVGVSAIFHKEDKTIEGVSFLTNGADQSEYRATSEMLAGSPSPASLPALGIFTAQSGHTKKINDKEMLDYKGRIPVGTLTLKFDQPVKDPILDFSGLGGYNIFSAHHEEASHEGIRNWEVRNGKIVVTGESASVVGAQINDQIRGSFNHTDLELETPGVKLVELAKNSNLKVDDRSISTVAANNDYVCNTPNDYQTLPEELENGPSYEQNDAFLSPVMKPAGCGSVLAQGEFSELKFTLFSSVEPMSSFAHDTHKTGLLYFAGGVNGGNANPVTPIPMLEGYSKPQEVSDTSNGDLFRMSIRLPEEPVKGSVSVGDFVWIDKDADGRQDSDEKGLAGVKLWLYGPDGGPVTDVHGNVVKSVTTGEDGKYSFKDLPVLTGSDSYTVKVVDVPAGYKPTLSGTGKVPAFKDSSTDLAKSTPGALSENGAQDLTLDFGFVKEPESPVEPEVKGSVSVGDFVWNDTNADGRQDDNEPGLAGVELQLVGPDGKPVTDVNGKPVGNVTTGEDGKYSFKDLPVLTGSDSYTVKVVDVPAGYKPTLSGTGKVPAFKDSSTDLAKSTPGALSENGAQDLTLDFGFVKESATPSDPTVPGFKWWIPLIPLALVPLIPMLAQTVGGSSAPATSAPQVPNAPVSTSNDPKPAPVAQKPQNKQLAATGASVLGLLAMALALIAGGVLLLRSRKES